MGGSRLKILAIERERSGATPDQFQPHLRPEAARVWELYQADVIREMYFDRDCHAAVLMLECPSVEQAREILGTLPLVREALITFDLIPLVPYSGFSRLFKEQ
jgi:hypothetical protein